MTLTLPALTLWQPYASLLVSGRKVNETRSWPCPEKYIGKRIAVHAAKRSIRQSEMDWYPELDELCQEEFGCSYPETLPRGAIVGTVTIATCRPTRLQDPASEDDFWSGDWDHGRFAWRCSGPVQFAVPFPCRGRQGFFSVDMSLQHFPLKMEED